MNSCVGLAGELLLRENLKNGFSKNVVVSPLSLNAVAAMLAAGSSEQTLDHVLGFLGCKTLDELKSVFSEMMAIATSNNEEEEGGLPKISFANGVWVDKRFRLKDFYRRFVSDVFKSEAKNVDFFHQADEAVKEINSWAEFQTKGLIRDVLQRYHITPLTALILGNALYFKGSWENKFNPEWTQKRDFFLLDEKKVSVPFMTSSRSYLYGSFDDNKVLEIPYQRGKEERKKFSMQFILPNKKDGLKNLLEKFNAESGFLNWHFQLSRTKLTEFWIPKFKFSCSLDNIRFPFMEKHLELTEMLHSGDPSISNIIQKAFIEVDEEGTEAAAVTLGMVFGCARLQEPEIKSFVADHPFMFIIKEKTSGLTLFTGAVLNPLVE
ncbi:hypothetical protein ACH5RR_016317 [Cinchona calisaya]|uniref:Serpin domain-containing protein n=1 Tax=Cinchona calisaya TaxID=153742 RepID=A0ABD2ZW05_9GENT